MMIFGIALGVALVVAVDLANESASRAFSLSTEAVTGRATHQVTGGSQGLAEETYIRLRREGVASNAAPVLSAYVTSPQLGGQRFELLGIDPFVDVSFRDYLGERGTISADQLSSFLTRSGAILISRGVADRYELDLGAQVEIETGGRIRQAVIAGILSPTDKLANRALEGMVLADIATAQELTGREGWLDRIDLILPDEPSVKAVQDWLPAGNQLGQVEARRGSMEQMTAAFRMNLTALSMLALVVGLFLIFNTMTFSVVQRRPLFGTLRCLGVTRREIFSMVLAEAAVIGSLGALAGIGLGILLGYQTVAMVTQTFNDLYFTTTVRSVGIPTISLIKGGLLGLGATVLTVLPPAWEAASVPPHVSLSRSGLELKIRRLVLAEAAGGLLLIGLGITLFAFPGSNLNMGFGGTFAVISGFAMLAAMFMVGLMLALVPIMAFLFGFLGRMAPRNLVNSLSRTSVAVSALMVAVAVTIGVNLMIASFRQTVEIWMESTLQGDVYISVPSFTATTPYDLIDPAIPGLVKKWPGVSSVDFMRSFKAQTPYGVVNVNATTNTNIASERMIFINNVDLEQIWPAMLAGGVIISEPLARRLDLTAVDSQIELYTPEGKKISRVLAIYYDYASNEGSLMMAMPYYRQVWHDQGVTAIDLRLSPGTDPDRLTAEMQDAFRSSQHLLIRPNLSLRADVMEVFDRTFAITSALRILATLVAFIGVLNTLLLLQMERQREFGILRAIGLTGKQLWKLVMMETGLMGLTAGLLAAPTGYVLSLILIYVINRRSFGWTLQLALPPEAFLQALGISLLAAFLAGVYPAWRLSRMETADVIRME